MKFSWSLNDTCQFNQMLNGDVLCAQYETTGDIYKIQYILRNEVVNDWVLRDDLGDDVQGYVEWQFVHLYNSEVVNGTATYRPL